MGSSVPSSATWVEPESTLAFLTVCLVHYYRIIHKRLPCGSWLQGSQAGRNCLPLCMHVCVCVRGKGVQHKTSITLHFILSCLRVRVSVLMLHPVVPVSAIIVHWLSSKLRMFQATHLRVTESVIQSVSQSLIHAFIQIASQANSPSERIAFKRIRTIASLPANIRKVRWVKTFRFFLGSNDIYNLKVD